MEAGERAVGGPGHVLVDQDLVQGRAQPLPEVVGACAGIGRADDAEHLGPGRRGHRVRVVGPLMVDLLAPVRGGCLEVEAVEEVLPPGESPAGQPAGEDLGEGAEVGPDAVLALRAPRRHPEAGHHFVEDEERPGLLRRLAERREE